MWYRIFCRNAEAPSATVLLDHLHRLGLSVAGEFHGDSELNWLSGQIQLGSGSPISLERYLTADDDLRNDLNTWAAWLETATWSEHSTSLMERVIQTQQLITLRKPIDHPDEVSLGRLCLETCRFLAANWDGIYQIDDKGWYSADGTLLVKEY